MLTAYIRSSIVILVTTFLACTKSDGSIIDIPDASSDSPNIIFILADDMGWDVFGQYPGINDDKAKTPTIDSLAKTGITFTNCWVNPVCAPTRASLLTGKYAFRTGVGGVQTSPASILHSSEITVQNYIKSQLADKYATALIGKWHLSSASQPTAPEDFGIGYYSGIFTGAVTDYYNWTQTSGGKQQTITTYATTHLVNSSISWIQGQTKPFFLWLAFNAPHTPFHRPPLTLISDQSLTTNQSEIDANPFPYYLASIEAMDKEIARLIASLTPVQKENTVFIFLGDNGTPTRVAQYPYTSNGTKSTLFQGGINMPLIISGKNVIRKNVSEPALVQAQDLFPTFAEIAGDLNSKYQDGVSLKPLLSDAGAAKRTFVYTEQFGQSSPNSDGYAIRNASYKLIHLENSKELLFNLLVDPFEQTDLLSKSLSTEAQQNYDQLKLIKAGL